MRDQVVVLIDDDEMFLSLAGAILTGAGYEVYTASDSTMAEELISGIDPSLIMLDIMMPSIEGDRMAKLLKENEETEFIPIVLMSGMSTEELEELVHRTGADGYLTKPFSFEELIEAAKKFSRTPPPSIPV